MPQSYTATAVWQQQLHERLELLLAESFYISNPKQKSKHLFRKFIKILIRKGVHYNGGILLFHPSFCRFLWHLLWDLCKSHKNIILENTLPEDKLQDPFKQSENVIKTLGSTSAVFSVLSLPLLFIPYDSILLFLFLLLLFSFIGSGYYLQIVYIRKMAALKCKTAGCYLSVSLNRYAISFK